MKETKSDTNTILLGFIIVLIIFIFGFLLFRWGVIGVDDGKFFFDCPMNNNDSDADGSGVSADDGDEEEDSEPTCADTDNGNNVYIFGTCTDSLGTVDSDNCIPEAGLDWIGEAYCENGVCAGISTECPDGYTCHNGECTLWEDLPRDCTSIWNPSQSVCSEFGICEVGEQCVFVPADNNLVERCACIPEL